MSAETVDHRAAFHRRLRPFHQALLSEKTQGGQTMTYVSWWNYIARAWDEFDHGFSKAVMSVQEIGQMAVVVIRITDHQTGAYMDSTGAVDLLVNDKRNPGKKRFESANEFGGPVIKAEQMALCRAMACFGVGINMYTGKNPHHYEHMLNGAFYYGEPGSEKLPEPTTEEAPQAEAPKPPTERQMTVIRTIASTLDSAGDVAFMAEQRAILAAAPTRETAGAIIRRMRLQLDEHGIDDPSATD